MRFGGAGFRFAGADLDGAEPGFAPGEPTSDLPGFGLGLPGFASGLPGFPSGLLGFAFGLPGFASGLPGFPSALAGFAFGLPGFAFGVAEPTFGLPEPSLRGGTDDGAGRSLVSGGTFSKARPTHSFFARA